MPRKSNARNQCGLSYANTIRFRPGKERPTLTPVIDSAIFAGKGTVDAERYSPGTVGAAGRVSCSRSKIRSAGAFSVIDLETACAASVDTDRVKRSPTPPDTRGRRRPRRPPYPRPLICAPVTASTRRPPPRARPTRRDNSHPPPRVLLILSSRVMLLLRIGVGARGSKSQSLGHARREVPSF